MMTRKYKYPNEKYHRIPVEKRVKRQKYNTPLLSALAVSMLCASLASAAGAKGIYEKYDTDGWRQPIIAVLMQGLADRKYPWSASSETGSGSSSLAAGGQADSSVSLLETKTPSLSNGSSPAVDGTSPEPNAPDTGSPSGLDAPNTGSSHGLEASDTGSSPGLEASDTGSSPGLEASDTGSSSGLDAPDTGSSSGLDAVPAAPASEGNAPDSESKPEQLTFTQVTQEYFDDALLIGDSRAEGVKLYSGWDNLTYYAEGGMTIYNMFQSRSAQSDNGKITVEEGLQSRSFGKIYLEIGINEMGTGTVDSFMEAYEGAVDHLRELQPDAILYLCGIMYVKQSKSESDPIFNNPNIQERNDRIAQLADGEHIFYLDINELVTDETGNLNPDYTWDEVHLLGKYDALWLDYFCSHGIVRDDSASSLPEGPDGQPEALP